METRRPTSPLAEEILGLYFPVLDHGFVSLIDYMGSDEDVERAARVSYGYGTRRTSETRGLIRYLRRHRHTTPSEMVELKFHCAMPIFIARQWVRHRSACLAEGTEVYFDLPASMRRNVRQLYKLKIEDIHRQFQRTSNRTRPDKQRNAFFRADRLKGMRLRQIDEDGLTLRHTELVNVFDSGVKAVFRMVGRRKEHRMHVGSPLLLLGRMEDAERSDGTRRQQEGCYVEGGVLLHLRERVEPGCARSLSGSRLAP